jgi:RNA polymerase sigma factor (sigma-70 family)
MAEKTRSSYRLSPAAAAFYAKIYAAARAGCCSELRRAGCSEDEAEEIFMATCEKVMSTVDPIARRFGPGQMVVLLKISCKRRLIDERRHQSVLSQVDLETVDALADRSARGPDDLAEDREAARRVLVAIESLPPLDRAVFRCRHGQGLRPDEICEGVPGLTPRRYRRTIQRANARVRKALEQAG